MTQPLFQRTATRASSPAQIVILRSQMVDAFQRAHSATKATGRLNLSVAENLGYRANETELAYLRDAARALRANADSIDTMVAHLSSDGVNEP